MVAPSSTTPYRILVCLARSSAESMGDSILSTVRKAAKLAVYEEMMMRVKNHQMPPTIRVDRALGMSSEPGVREVAGVNVTLQNVFIWASPHYGLVQKLKSLFLTCKNKIRLVPLKNSQTSFMNCLSWSFQLRQMRHLLSRRNHLRVILKQDDYWISKKLNYLVSVISESLNNAEDS